MLLSDWGGWQQGCEVSADGSSSEEIDDKASVSDGGASVSK